MTTSIQDFKDVKNGSRKTRLPFVVMAVNSPLSKEDEKAMLELELDTQVEQCQGSYKGKTETSYMVVPERNGDIYAAICAARHHRQESVLMVGPEREAWLFFINLSMHGPVLGKFQEVTAGEALDCEAWTRVGNRFFIVK